MEYWKQVNNVIVALHRLVEIFSNFISHTCEWDVEKKAKNTLVLEEYLKKVFFEENGSL